MGRDGDCLRRRSYPCSMVDSIVEMRAWVFWLIRGTEAIRCWISVHGSGGEGWFSEMCSRARSSFLSDSELL